MTEYELRFDGIDVTDIRKRIKNLGYIKLHAFKKYIASYFYLPGERHIKSGFVRLRQEGDNNIYLTVKTLRNNGSKKQFAASCSRT